MTWVNIFKLKLNLFGAIFFFSFVRCAAGFSSFGLVLIRWLLKVRSKLIPLIEIENIDLKINKWKKNFRHKLIWNSHYSDTKMEQKHKTKQNKFWILINWMCIVYKILYNKCISNNRTGFYRARAHTQFIDTHRI